MRTKKNIIDLNFDSALALMQEIYNDITEQKNMASMIMKKMLNFMKDSDDMNTIGLVIKEQQKIMYNCTEKKLTLLKLQSTIIKQNNPQEQNGSGYNGGKLTITDEDRAILEQLMKETDKSSDLGSENYLT